MSTPLHIEIYNQIIRKLTSIKWLQKWNIDKYFIDKHIKDKKFKDKLELLIQCNNFTAKGTLKLCKAMLDELSLGNSPKDWLSYIYQYTLNKSFPETITINLLEELNAPCEVYLRIFRIICDFQKCSDNKSWENKYPLNFLTEEEQQGLEHGDEYKKFVKYFNENFTYEMMKINGEITGFNTLDHVCGVHHLSLYIARQLKSIKFPVDLGRVSGAAGGHDIGKYGCKGAELKRVPRLHYYYTDQWFKRYNLTYIGNIALNHSTWDLELENLSLESLLLIYSDFRVKNKFTEKGPEMTLFSLENSFHVILDKLENVDEEKIKRYKRVYAKLKDFEDFLLNLNISINPNENITPIEKKVTNYTLIQGTEIVNNLKYLAINHNINLMYHLRDEYSLDELLEIARSETDWKNLREYIRIFEEYSTYLTKQQKLQTIKFLYENLTHTEDDIRRHCAELIGNLIAIFDEDYRKEIPEKVKLEEPLTTSSSLLEEYLQLMLFPGHKVITAHKFNIGYSISIMVNSLFSYCRKSFIEKYRDLILSYFDEDKCKNTDCELFLLETAKFVPLTPYSSNVDKLIDFISLRLKKRNSVVRLQALETSLSLISKLPKNHVFLEVLKEHLLSVIKNKSKIPAENLLLFKISSGLNLKELMPTFIKYCELNNKTVTDIFLSNLKTATDWIRKRNHVELLTDYSLKHSQSDKMHTAIHFCNLLKVSAIESVRNRAGKAVLNIIPHLSLAERNEVSVELLRALEIEGNKFTEYIPRYTGEAILWLQPKELDEIIDDSFLKIKTANSNLKSLVLKTIGVTICNYENYKDRFPETEEIYHKRLNKMLGILLNGLSSYDDKVKQSAFNVIGKDIFGSSSLNFKRKKFIFQIIGKKVLTLITEKENESLLFLTRSASLNHIYRFISDYSFFFENIDISIPKKVAFFPGTFDPFSLSHKEIAKHIRDMGFEVYLAVDEFSWSKKTLPSLLRRNLLNMSISDELNIYIYPGTMPINIANPNDLKILKESFPNSIVYMCIGSDVLLNASSYKLPKSENSIHTFSHVIFERGKSKKFNSAVKNIEGDVVVLTLSSKYAEISSTQIRNYIDESRDISYMVDPMTQQYIYENGFYQREAQDKYLLKSTWLELELLEDFSEENLNSLKACIPHAHENIEDIFLKLKTKPSFRILILKNSITNQILGFSVFHWVRSGTIYDEFKSPEISEYIREHSTGRIILIDGIFIKSSEKHKDFEEIILTETLALCISKDYEYAVYKSIFDKNPLGESMKTLLKSYGFINISNHEGFTDVFTVNMSNPCILNLDINTILKEPFRSDVRIRNSISICRRKLQQAIIKLYPGELLLSFDVNFLYERLIKKICEENEVPTEIIEPRQLGSAMCVPYGDILDRYIIPNTVTKALHTEKFFNPNLKNFSIGEFPHYLDLKTQVKMIKSFNRPIILVDNLLHKGYRIKALDPIFKNEKVHVQKILAGILSGRGKDLMDMQNRNIDSVYFIPRLKLWFNESALYPFIGGDALWRGIYTERNLLPSINLILPYTAPHFIRNTSQKHIYELSKVCIENAINILEVIEDEYHIVHEKTLTLSSLGQVFTIPRCPDHGKDMEYNLNLSPSNYLKNDLELLLRFESSFK